MKRKAVGKTPAGSVITVKEAKPEGGLEYLVLDVVNQNGHQTVMVKLSHNVAWALMQTLGAYLPPNGAECSIELET